MIEEAFIWLGSTTTGTFLAQSTAAFAATESLHIVALALVGGIVLVTDLAVLGVVLKATPVQTVFDQLRPVWIGSLVIVAISGVLLVAAGPYKYYSNPLFPLKLGLLVVALIAQYVLGRRVSRAVARDGATRALAATSLFLWTAVVIAGRWLGLI